MRHCILKFLLERAEDDASVLVLSNLRVTWDIANPKLLNADSIYPSVDDCILNHPIDRHVLTP